MGKEIGEDSDSEEESSESFDDEVNERDKKDAALSRIWNHVKSIIEVINIHEFTFNSLRKW